MLFSFGIVLFELGTGLRAYDQHRENQYLMDHVDNENSDWDALVDLKAGPDCMEHIFKPLMIIGILYL